MAVPSADADQLNVSIMETVSKAVGVPHKGTAICHMVRGVSAAITHDGFTPWTRG